MTKSMHSAYLPYLSEELKPLADYLKRDAGWRVAHSPREDDIQEELLGDLAVSLAWQRPGEPIPLSPFEILFPEDEVEPFDIAFIEEEITLTPFGGEDVLENPFVYNAGLKLFHSSGANPLDFKPADYATLPPTAMAFSCVMTNRWIAGIELIRLPLTSREALTMAERWLSETGLPVTVVEYNVPGGAAERVRIPLEIEAWRMVREGIAAPNVIDLLSAQMLGTERGVLRSISDSQPSWRNEMMFNFSNKTRNDARFRPLLDALPPEGPGTIWETLDDPVEPLNGPQPGKPPKRVLIVGTPHLADAWRDRIYETTKGKVRPEILTFWEAGSIQEDELAEVLQSGPFDLLIEVLVGPINDRHEVINLFLPYLEKGGQIWTHTLNVPATLTVQVVPEEFSAVGFSGVPAFGPVPVIEFSQPLNSDASDLQRAAGFARALGLEPYEVADETGGVGPRLFSVLVNSTIFLVREGVVASERQADAVAANLFDMKEPPLSLADEIGLDSVEAVLLGLQVLLGEERYRICPLITLRIESGAVGRITGKGFYTK